MVQKTPLLTKLFRRQSKDDEREKNETEIESSKKELVSSRMAIRSGARVMENMSGILSMITETKNEK